MDWNHYQYYLEWYFGSSDWFCKLVLLKVIYWSYVSLFSCFLFLCYQVASTYFFYQTLCPSNLFDNTDSTIYQEGKKHMKQGSFTYDNKGHSEGRMFRYFSSFKSTHLKLIMLRDL